MCPCSVSLACIHSEGSVSLASVGLQGPGRCDLAGPLVLRPQEDVVQHQDLVWQRQQGRPKQGGPSQRESCQHSRIAVPWKTCDTALESGAHRNGLTAHALLNKAFQKIGALIMLTASCQAGVQGMAHQLPRQVLQGSLLRPC